MATGGIGILREATREAEGLERALDRVLDRLPGIRPTRVGGTGGVARPARSPEAASLASIQGQLRRMRQDWLSLNPFVAGGTRPLV